MKKILMGLMIMTLSFAICGCGSEKIDVEPETTQIRSICKLATLECYYHNVAKATKAKGTGLLHTGEKDRKFWVEYDGIVSIGIDMEKVKMEVDGSTVTITIPHAEVLGVKVDEKSYNKDSILEDADAINSNKITAQDVTSAVQDSINYMKESAGNNSSLLANAEDRAIKLIENYVRQIGALNGTDYKVRWDYLTNE